MNETILVVIIAIVTVLFVISKNNEGFSTRRTADNYYDQGGWINGPRQLCKHPNCLPTGMQN